MESTKPIQQYSWIIKLPEYPFQTLTGLVWLCVVGQIGNVSLKCFTNTIQAYPSPTTGAVSAGKLALSYNTYYYGALPTSTGGAPEGMTYYPPLVNLRLA